MAFWGVEVKPGKPFTHSPDKACERLRLSQATLGIGSSNNKSLVQCNVGKKSPVLLCSLLPGILESCHLELEFEEAEGVTFSVIGARSVHLTGYYRSNVRHLAGIEESESFGEDIRETDSEKSDDHFDEDEYEDSFIDDGDPELSPGSPFSDEVGSKKKTKSKAAKILKFGRRLIKKKYEFSESEDDHVPFENDTTSDHLRGQIVESDDDDHQLPISSMLGNEKTVCEDSNRKDCSSDENQSEEEKCKGKKQKSNKGNEAPGENQSDKRNVGKRKRKSSEESEKLAVDTADKDQSEEKKVKKKKRKSGKEDEAPKDADSRLDLGDSGADLLTKPICKTLSGGLIVEELEIGDPDGKMAVSGKKVTIHYTGKVKEGGQAFDSTVGKKPLKFRLGKGHALDGLDIGIEGMRVGDKRRLLIPPALGYGDEGSELVPPNSWLIMDVELLRVR